MAAMPPSVSNVGQLTVRAGKNPLALGAVTFSSEETPSKLSIGAGQQMLVVTDLPGGGRIVEDFGNSADEISWEGHFFGPNIGPRVQQIRAYRISGQPQILSFKNERYSVKIKSFDPGYKGGYNEYRIACVVIKDLNGAFTVASPTSVDQQVSALQAQAIQQNAAITSIDATGSATFQQAFVQLQAALAQYAPLAQNIVPGATPILTAVTEAVNGITDYQSSLLVGASQAPYVAGMIDALNAIGANVQNAQAANTVTVTGGDLFSVAALQYGDVSQCFNLAAANGMVQPLLPSGVTQPIVIPPQQVAS